MIDCSDLCEPSIQLKDLKGLVLCSNLNILSNLFANHARVLKAVIAVVYPRTLFLPREGPKALGLLLAKYGRQKSTQSLFLYDAILPGDWSHSALSTTGG